MRFAGYLAPNLIFAMLIVLAWINLDWGGDGLQFQKGAEYQEQPLAVMHDGELQHSGGKGNRYTLRYAQLELFPNNRIKVTQPIINGRAAGSSVGGGAGDGGETGSSDYSLSGDLLTSTEKNEFLISGAPAEFVITSSDSRATGNGKQITYELADRVVLSGAPAEFVITSQDSRTSGSGRQITYELDHRVVLSGEPAEFVIRSSDGRTAGSGRQITYEFAEQLVTIYSAVATSASADSAASPDASDSASGERARVQLRQADGSQVDGEARQITLQQADNRAELNGQVELQYVLDGRELQLAGSQATIAEERLVISGGISMRHLYKGGAGGRGSGADEPSREIFAQAQRGSYMPGGELHLVGAVKITAGGNTVDAAEAFYDAGTATWRLGGETGPQQGGEQERVKIIIKQ